MTVYLGFGDLAFKESFRNSAKKYFDILFELGSPTSYLKERFEDNTFYHPQYLCGNGSNNPQSLIIRRNFKQKPLDKDIVPELPKLKMPKDEMIKIVNGINDLCKGFNLEPYKYNPKDNKTIRFRLPLNLQITITATGNGYIGIRHLDNFKLKNYCIESYPSKSILDGLFLDKYGFYRNETTKMWMAVKEIETFKDVESLASFIKSLYDELLSINMNIDSLI